VEHEVDSCLLTPRWWFYLCPLTTALEYKVIRLLQNWIKKHPLMFSQIILSQSVFEQAWTNTCRPTPLLRRRSHLFLLGVIWGWSSLGSACGDARSEHFITFIRDFWVFGLCPSSGILKNTTFRKQDLFPCSGEVGRRHLLGPLGRANLSHWTIGLPTLLLLLLLLLLLPPPPPPYLILLDRSVRGKRKV
jgi:hypothetical protein